MGDGLPSMIRCGVSLLAAHQFGDDAMERSVTNLPLQDNRKTQADRIEDLLRSRYAQWFAAYELADVALQYCARVNQIRKKLRAAGDREQIENKTEWVKGVCHGSYRLCLKDSSEPPEPVKETRNERALRFELEYKPRPTTFSPVNDHPRVTGLPLFDLGVQP